ncbi:MAG: hypothetical protein HYT76_06195 [Deltaproteobacteria bacterium]|nr:hypothetical protein [Deltaproteobacteria bacterium]
MRVAATSSVNVFEMDAEYVYRLRGVAPNTLRDHLRALVRSGCGQAIFSIEANAEEALAAAYQHRVQHRLRGQPSRVQRRNVLESVQLRVNRAARIVVACLGERYEAQVVAGNVTLKMVRQGGTKTTLHALVLVGIETGLSILVFGVSGMMDEAPTLLTGAVSVPRVS